MPSTNRGSPVVSIVIPVFNRERLLESCVTSALAQGFDPFEVIVIDNCSSDGTWEVCQRLAAANSRVRIFRNDRNYGPVGNWARGIAQARGQYCKLLFSDDILDPNYLKSTIPLLTKDVGFVFSGVTIGSSPELSATAYLWRKKTGHYPSIEFIHSHFRGENVPVSPGCGIFRTEDARKNLLSVIPNPEKTDCSGHGAGPDVLMYLLTATQYPKVGFCAESLAFFRSHPGSFTVSGMGGAVKRGYLAALAWFGESRVPGVFAAYARAMWINEMVSRRRPISFSYFSSPLLHGSSFRPGLVRSLLSFVAYSITKAAWVLPIKIRMRLPTKRAFKLN